MNKIDGLKESLSLANERLSQKLNNRAFNGPKELENLDKVLKGYTRSYDKASEDVRKAAQEQFDLFKNLVEKTKQGILNHQQQRRQVVVRTFEAAAVGTVVAAGAMTLAVPALIALGGGATATGLVYKALAYCQASRTKPQTATPPAGSPTTSQKPHSLPATTAPESTDSTNLRTARKPTLRNRRRGKQDLLAFHPNPSLATGPADMAASSAAPQKPVQIAAPAEEPTPAPSSPKQPSFVLTNFGVTNQALSDALANLRQTQEKKK